MSEHAYRAIAEEFLKIHDESLRAILAGDHGGSVHLTDTVSVYFPDKGPLTASGNRYGWLTAGDAAIWIRLAPDGTLHVGTRGEESFGPYRLVQQIIATQRKYMDGEQNDEERLIQLDSFCRTILDARWPSIVEVAKCEACTRSAVGPAGLLRCSRCGTLIRRSIGTETFRDVYTSEDGAYFRSLDCPLGDTSAHGYEDYEEWVRVIVGSRKLVSRTDLVRQAVTAPQSQRPVALDVGCATGEFVGALTDAGFTATGIDISPHCIERARHLHPAATFACGTIADFGGPADLVSYLDVFEHLDDPAGELAQVRRVLRTNGLLLLELPNQGSIDAAVLRHHYLFREHLFFYTPKGISALLSRNGFKVLNLWTEHDAYFRVDEILGPELAAKALEANRGERLIVLARSR